MNARTGVRAGTSSTNWTGATEGSEVFIKVQKIRNTGRGDALEPRSIMKSEYDEKPGRHDLAVAPVQGVDLPSGRASPRCRHCTHPMVWHDDKGCRSGRGNVHGGCGCDRNRKGKTIMKTAPAADASPPALAAHETLFSKALGDAAIAAHAMGEALARAATEARLAHAAASGTVTTPPRPLPSILDVPVPPKAAKPNRLAVERGVTALPTLPSEQSGEAPETRLPPAKSGVLDLDAVIAKASLSESAKQVLAAIAIYPNGATTTQIVAQTPWAARTIQNLAVPLRAANLIERGALKLTREGREFLDANPVDFTPRALNGSELAVLGASARYENGATTVQLALHTKLSTRTIQNILLVLRREGFIDRSSGAITPEGRAKLPADGVSALEGARLIAYHLEDLPQGEAEIFRLLLAAGDAEVTTSDLAEQSDLSQRTVQNILTNLRKRLLVVKGGNTVTDTIAKAFKQGANDAAAK